ncbi:hypothetical protein B296_00016789 [Ensete ventricosum]|uniref:Uncharacterized protein n=1 Tax=Ensete ventricosum TaxID=4639 RepID=A0A427B4W0_ENSVE|nr:hypothetical protein B296_00016789 [Ensete ventricosum]
MHLISQKHLPEELRRLNFRRRSWGHKALARDDAETGSSTSVNNMTTKRAIDSMSECHGTTEAGLTIIKIAEESNCSIAYIRLREPNKSEDKTEVLVVKRVEEVENVEVNFKYQDKTKGRG